MSINTLINSNNEIIKLINNDKPFSVVRLGIGPETHITIDYLTTGKINTKYLHPSVNLNGIYSRSNDINKFKLFCEFYKNGIKSSDILASFNRDDIRKIQNWFASNYQLPQIHSRSLEPFYVMNLNEIPWTHHLKDKKVLIINPFVDSFKKQIKNNFQMFKDKKIFLNRDDFIFYKSYQTIAGNHLHKDWFETFKLMCKDIKKLDFDIALLGCGGYGLPLCDFIKNKLNKSAIYVGGGLQLLFGVIGTRWENNAYWKSMIEENGCKFIKPSGDEICNNLKSIENGCYW